jgi:hypothetical protein
VDEYTEKLTLGKRSAFVKSRLSRLPGTDEVWEADFRPVSIWGWDSQRHGELWLGLVLSHEGDFHQAVLALTEPPTVNDMAKLLAEAMERPGVMGARRPGLILLRDDTTWRELLPHLKQLKIAVETRTELPLWDASAADYVRRLRASRMGREVPVLVLPPDLDETFPAVTRWLKGRGRIEMTGNGGRKIVARAVDAEDDHVLFEDTEPEGLHQAMVALERWLGDTSP